MVRFSTWYRVAGSTTVAELKAEEKRLANRHLPFSNDELDQYFRVKRRLGKYRKWRGGDNFLQAMPEGELTFDDLKTWTNAIKFGSEVSDKYLAFIMAYIQELGQEQVDRVRTSRAVSSAD